MTAVKTLATMEGLAETWLMTFSVNVKMGGKERLATRVSCSSCMFKVMLNVLRCVVLC